ncbi:Frizzled 9 [Fasciola gigantica]|uniref:Frizzled 9 n=1 Tax=Fasciola gigantica TaxID=46835 RepID=A0A504YEH4_FASGI|nr:Frizzled 9 [Fasciola gigantica]
MCIQPQNYDLDQQSPLQQSASLLGQDFSGVGRKTIAELIPDLTQLFSPRRQDTSNTERAKDQNISEAALLSQSFARGSTKKQIFNDDVSIKVSRNAAYCRASELTILTEKTSTTIHNVTCAQQCHANVFYRPAEKQFSDIWLMIWSVLCVLSCSLTLLTFILDRARFAYPELSVRSNLKHHAALLLISNRSQLGQRGQQVPSSGSTLFRSHMTTAQHGNVRRLDKLMAKVCIFSILYIIPTTCVIGVNIYKYGNFPKWQRDLDRLDQRDGCLTAHGTNWARADFCLEGLQFPSVEANMLQSFMSLVVGITSGMWVWCNRKTFTSWTHCVRTAKQPWNGTRKNGIPVAKVKVMNGAASADGQKKTNG